jgi:hypothetical protein
VARIDNRHSKWWDTLREFCLDHSITHFEDRIADIVCEAINEDGAAWTGSSGGRKGGPARAKSMTAAERSESASKAARARWNTPK